MSSSEEETYEVEDIRDKRKSLKNIGGVEYYVKWVGWDSDTNTWEPPEHLETCMGLVEQFERKLARRKERREAKRKEDIQKREQKHQRRKEREMANVNKLKSVDTSDSDEKDVGKDINHNNVKAKSISRGLAHDEEGKVKVKKNQKLFSEDSDSDSVQTKIKGKYFKELIPVRIVGLTKDPPLPGLHFCIEFKKVDEEGSPIEVGLIAAKEAYEKIPQMCLQFYEKHLVWNENGSSASAL